ncbi:hypothetical protein VYU27_008193 [Nannochloropsis oceanica]
MPQRFPFSSSPMVLILLCTVTREAFGFQRGIIVPTHMRRAMGSFSTWTSPLSSLSYSSSSSSSSFASSSVTVTTARLSSFHRHRSPFMPPTNTALFASSTASSGAGKKKKAASLKSKASVKKVIEDEEDDEDEMTEAELLKVMQSGEAMDAVWQRMMSQMERTGALEGEDDKEEDDDDEDEDEDEDGDKEDNAEEDLSGNDDSDDDDDNDDSNAVKIDAMDRKHGLPSSMSSSSSSQDEAESDDNLGTIQIRNSQRSISLDIDVLHNHIRGIMEIIGKDDHDVSLWLTNDRSIREYNDRYRGKRSATDILSFPFHEYKSPGVPTPESVALNGQIKDLGDMMVSTGYVQRQCARDEADWAAEGENQWSEERGASGAMARVYDVQGRLPFLVIHGLLHLLGYDHETEKEYEEMVREEERVISEFARRFPEAAPPMGEPKKSKERNIAAAAVGEDGGKAKKKASGVRATKTTTAPKRTASAAASSKSKAPPKNDFDSR